MRTETTESSSEEMTPDFSDFEAAKMAAQVDLDWETFRKLIRYLSVPEREMEVIPLFFSLDYPKQIQFIVCLLAEVFEGAAGHNDPPTIEYRKRISNELRLVKNEINLNMALSEALRKPDAAIKFFRANPHRIESFFAELVREHKEESKAITESLLLHLIGKLRKPAN